MEKYTVKIAGITLSLKSDEPAEYVEGLTRLLDSRMTKMLASSPQLNISEAALFCAVDSLDDKLKTANRLEKVQAALERTTKELSQLRADNAELLAIIDAGGLGKKTVNIFDTVPEVAKADGTAEEQSAEKKADNGEN